jgi:hypothetical protein
MIQPEQDQPFTIFLILLKALSAAPFGSDFNLCLAMLTEQLVRGPSLSSKEIRGRARHSPRLGPLPSFWRATRHCKRFRPA